MLCLKKTFQCDFSKAPVLVEKPKLENICENKPMIIKNFPIFVFHKLLKTPIQTYARNIYNLLDW